MENDNSKEREVDLDHTSFLKDAEAPSTFAGLHDQLRAGTHIQFAHPEQEEQFRFIERNFDSLAQYYKLIYKVRLEFGGAETDTYFYIDFEDGRRGEIKEREFLSGEHLLIGVFMCKVYNIDFSAHESSVLTFVSLLKTEYEHYKDGFYRFLAQTRKETYTGEDDINLEKAIRGALNTFKNLGWLYFKNDEQFVVMPSLERLRKLYADEINNPQKLVLPNTQEL
jgi:hypothetical protein